MGIRVKIMVSFIGYLLEEGKFEFFRMLVVFYNLIWICGGGGLLSYIFNICVLYGIYIIF